MISVGWCDLRRLAVLCVAAPCQEFGLLSHGIFQDNFRCLIGSLVVKLHRNAHFIVVGMGPTTINCCTEQAPQYVSK